MAARASSRRVGVRQCGYGSVEIVVVEFAVKALQDAVIELPLVACIELQLVFRVVDIANAEDVLVEKLLRTLAEVFELGRGDTRQRGSERRANRFVVALGEEVAVEDGLGAGLGD